MSERTDERPTGAPEATDTACLVAVFDVISVRDLDVLAQLGERHGPVTIALLDDDLVHDLYGRPPLTGIEDRLALVSHLRGVGGVRRYRLQDPVPGRRYVIAREPVPHGEGFVTVTPRRVSAADSVTAATASVPGHGTAA
ncbi:MAG TPA: hypothetical protein IAA98_07730 [Candidatus Avipropionibacterium avicola]|uniref:Uncharacterized protein n=1 Tax=Candidatus Avipropionibacterium avicola TaxID=2840701 RepID=A0A9D1GX94_9ACTN|nr:hypothetical protein [Candidatus Avipropionibacterium avicola]